MQKEGKARRLLTSAGKSRRLARKKRVRRDALLTSDRRDILVRRGNQTAGSSADVSKGVPPYLPGLKPWAEFSNPFGQLIVSTVRALPCRLRVARDFARSAVSTKLSTNIASGNCAREFNCAFLFSGAFNFTRLTPSVGRKESLVAENISIEPENVLTYIQRQDVLKTPVFGGRGRRGDISQRNNRQSWDYLATQ